MHNQRHATLGTGQRSKHTLCSTMISDTMSDWHVRNTWGALHYLTDMWVQSFLQYPFLLVGNLYNQNMAHSLGENGMALFSILSSRCDT